MKVRIGRGLLAKMQKASFQHGITYSEMARKALRKYGHCKPDLSALDPGSTYQGTELRLDVVCDGDHIRRVLSWYIDLYKDCPPPAPLKLDKPKIRPQIRFPE